MTAPDAPAGSEHYREGWRDGYDQARIDRDRDRAASAALAGTTTPTDEVHRTALLALVQAHSIIDEDDPFDGELGGHRWCRECGHEVSDEPCPTVAFIAKQVGVAMDSEDPVADDVARLLALLASTPTTDAQEG